MALTDIIYTTRQKLTELYDAIREKTGVTGTMTIDQATEAVESISGDEVAKNVLNRANVGWPMFTVDFAALGVTSITEYACDKGNRIASIVLPNDSTLTIGKNAFENCANLTIPARKIVAHNIDSTVFSGCSMLDVDRVEVDASAEPSTTVHIGNYAFYSCRALSHPAIIYTGKFGNSSFANCLTMTRVWVDSRTTIQANNTHNAGLFNACTALKDIYTDAENRPETWGAGFEWVNQSTEATIHYGVSLEEYEALED